MIFCGLEATKPDLFGLAQCTTCNNKISTNNKKPLAIGFSN